ncbi:MAG: GTPase ObgE [Verrucomicrobiota bacterium]|nr:GTPase ObgE [Verrucomicrobiota bacterium]
MISCATFFQMFVDEAKVKLRAGKGGNGCVSFRRAKFEPWGGPNGGDGGRGGDVVILCDDNTGDLRDYYFKPHWDAQNGENGKGSDMHGFNGKDAVLKVPAGTVIYSEETGMIVAELTKHDERIVLLEGGNGGWGNIHFKNSVNQAPQRANPGLEGKTGDYRFVLKTIADVGLVGFPNAGKSSLIKEITKSRPKTAPYPFTTLHPNVGVIEYPEYLDRIFMADVPGLIEGASENKGLGHRFLRHIERCKMLLFMVDMAAEDNRDPRQDYATLLNELELYDKALIEKPRVIVANKMDMPEAKANLTKFKRKYKVELLPISCLSGDGIPALLDLLYKRIKGSG